MTRETYQFGITSIELHTKELRDAIEAGMHCQFSTSAEGQLTLTGEELIAQVIEHMHEEPDPLRPGRIVPPEWRVGFTVGCLIAMLYPDLHEHYRGYRPLAMLSKRCESLFNGYRQQVEQETQE